MLKIKFTLNTKFYLTIKNNDKKIKIRITEFIKKYC